MFRFHHTAPFRAQPPILPSIAAYGKRLLKPCIRMGYVPKGWLTWKTDRTTGGKVYVLALASSC